MQTNRKHEPQPQGKTPRYCIEPNNDSKKSSPNLDTSRSKLSKATFIKWFRMHCPHPNPKTNRYFYFPEELIRETSMESIFDEFDADGSGGLSRDEVFEMFNGFGIPITMKDLNKLYDSVEINLEEMDCKMFKRCAMSEKSNRVFRDIVSTMGEGMYLPHNFTNMIVYLVYLSKREEIRGRVVAERTEIGEKVQRIDCLLRLKDLSLNNERLNLYLDAFKQGLKNKFRDVWEGVNERYGQNYPLTVKLEDEFYEYYQLKLADKRGK